VRVVGFTGMPGSGKSMAAQVARDAGVPVLRMGDCVWDEVRARGFALSDDNVGRVAQEMRAKHGPGIWAERTLEKIRGLHANRVAIDGIRSLAEVDAFHKELGRDFVLVAIVASPATRHARLLARAREDEAGSEEAARQRDQRELAWGVGAVIALADVVLLNEVADEATFQRRVANVLAA
jgi:dephospho-CoA kinase